MTQRNRSLLEAFKASGVSSGGTPPPAQSPAPPPAGGAPAPSPLRVSLTDTRPARSVVLLRSQFQLLGVVALLAIACAFLLGRASVRIASANTDSVDDNAGVLEQQPVAQPAPAAVQSPSIPASSANSAGARPDVDRNARSAAEQALVDPKNQWTIKLIEYTNTDAHKQLALETSNYITQQGLPASVVTTSARFVIVVGAAPAQVDLDALLQRCKTVKGPPPQLKDGEFQDAYVVKIDKVFKRDNK